MAAMVNPMGINPLQVKDSRWLTLEVCREFTRQKCTRPDTECKFAHPPPYVEVQNGRVTCCYDSIKGKCQRKDPPCKYLHPPQHLREQLLQNGRNNLILKNLQMQAMAAGAMPHLQLPSSVIPTQIMYDGGGGGVKASPYATSHLTLPGQYPLVAHPYIQMQNAAFSPYINPSTVPVAGMVPTIDTSSATLTGASANQIAQNVIPSPGVAAQQKVSRADRLEVCREFQRGTCTRQPSECRFAHPPDTVTVDTTDNHVTVCMDYVKGKCSRESCRYFHPPPHLQAQIKAAQQRANATAAAQAQALGVPGMPGVVPMVKRPAVADSKSGIPVYQPGTGTTAAYQQAALAAMQLQQQPFVPVTIAGHPPSVPRF